MSDSRPNPLGQALRGFLADELPRVRGLSRHTIHSFRDALKLLLVFLERHLQRPAAQLDFPDLSREHLLAFLQHLENQRGNCIATRNVRLAALHSFARYAAPLFPAHCGVCQVILGIPFKRADQPAVEYLEHDEMQALLAAPDRSTEAGRRAARAAGSANPVAVRVSCAAGPPPPPEPCSRIAPARVGRRSRAARPSPRR